MGLNNGRKRRKEAAATRHGTSEPPFGVVLIRDQVAPLRRPVSAAPDEPASVTLAKVRGVNPDGRAEAESGGHELDVLHIAWDLVLEHREQRETLGLAEGV